MRLPQTMQMQPVALRGRHKGEFSSTHSSVVAPRPKLRGLEPTLLVAFDTRSRFASCNTQPQALQTQKKVSDHTHTPVDTPTRAASGFQEASDRPRILTEQRVAGGRAP